LGQRNEKLSMPPKASLKIRGNEELFAVRDEGEGTPSTFIKKISKKTKIDYGRDRDVDVEGVNDYMLWHENFHNKQTLPILPR